MTIAPVYGSVREVWLAPLATPADKNSFLIRDDAYSKAGATFGRTVRLGDPVNLGPNSAWRQLSWEGGNDQDVWSDEFMFKEGTADGYSDRGKLKLPAALGTIYSGAIAGTTVQRLCLGTNALNASRSTPTPLLIGEDHGFGADAGNYTLFKKDPGGALTTIGTVDAGITAFSPPDDNSHIAYLGTSNGKVYQYDQSAGSITLDYTEPAGGIAFNSMALYQDSLYWLASNHLVRRTNTTGTPTYTGPFEPAGIQQLRGMAVWNGRLWFGGITPNRRTRIFTYDGSLGQEAFAFSDEFEIMGMAVHYGQLYICGSQGAADRDGWKGQVWRYTGAQLQRVYEVGEETSGEDHCIWDMATMGRYLCWPQSARASNDHRSGIVYYDAELDAIHLGPNRAESGDYTLHSIESYDNTLVVGGTLDAGGEQVVRPVRKLGRVQEASGQTTEKFVLSSRFDGDIPGEEKSWLTGRVRCKLPTTYTEVEVVILLDESTTETSVKTVSFDAGNTGWRTVTFPIKVSGDYPQSTTIQYKVYLRNTNTADTETTDSPEVDSVEIEYIPAPTKRRTWRVRMLASNAQERLDETANALDTAEELVQKLEDLWSAQKPVYFWDAGTAGGTPPDTTNAVEVWITDYLAQSYRIDNLNTDIAAEVSLTLTEVVQS